jgi:hypothetical protein
MKKNNQDLIPVKNILDGENNWDVIYEDEINKITLALKSILLFANLLDIDNQKLSKLFHDHYKFGDLVPTARKEDIVKFVGLRYRLKSDIKNVTGAELHLAVVPLDLPATEFQRIWILYFRDKETHINYLNKKEKNE